MCTLTSYSGLCEDFGMDFLKDFAIRVASWRRYRGLNQQQLAERCGITQTAVSKLESGANTTTLITLNEIVTVGLQSTMAKFWSRIPKARKAAKASARAQAAA